MTDAAPYECDRNTIIATHPLLEYCRGIGLEMRRSGREWKGLCPLHDERTPSFSVDPEKALFCCHGCGAGGTVIDLHAKLRGLSIGEAMRDLSPCGGNSQGDGTRQSREKPKPATSPEGDAPSPVEIVAYDYQDATGRVRFAVVRFEPKDFKQCRIDERGQRVWNMDGVERLPYRLPEILAADAAEVWIVEGEKDVETLRQIKGTVATCNPGGAGKWLPAFSQYLRSKGVLIIPDRDEQGAKHAAIVLASLAGLVKWVKWIELPPEHKGRALKDVSVRSHGGWLS
jgi:DNA primase